MHQEVLSRFQIGDLLRRHILQFIRLLHLLDQYLLMLNLLLLHQAFFQIFKQAQFYFSLAQLLFKYQSYYVLGLIPLPLLQSLKLPTSNCLKLDSIHQTNILLQAYQLKLEFTFPFKLVLTPKLGYGLTYPIAFQPINSFEFETVSFHHNPQASIGKSHYTLESNSVFCQFMPPYTTFNAVLMHTA